MTEWTYSDCEFRIVGKAAKRGSEEVGKAVAKRIVPLALADTVEFTQVFNTDGDIAHDLALGNFRKPQPYLDKMLVERESLLDTQLLHHHKAHTIRKAEGLVIIVLKQIESFILYLFGYR